MIDYAFSLHDLEFFLLIFTRVSCFIFIAPFFSMTNTPRNVRVAIAFFVSAFLYQLLTPSTAIIMDNVYVFALYVMKEAIAGLLIGFSTTICTGILAFAGTIADMEIGLTMVQALDPATRQMTSITGAIYNYAFTMILVCTGMYRYFLGALVDTFTLIPVGEVHFDSSHLLESMVQFMSDYVLIGFRIILPIFAAIIMLNAILGIIAKVSPQMNMFSIGIQLKIITGLGVLFLTIGLLPHAADMIYVEMKKMMVRFVSGMM